MERKLAAILSADVKGYSRLMGEDEEATIRTLTAYREEMATIIRQHRGRVVDSPGDNLLAEFVSVVDAVQGAVVIQSTLRAEIAEVLKINARFSLAGIRQRWPYKDPTDLERLLAAALRKAGLE
jgi:class 3 adenylate cyclase